jgi:hypothetical protein
MEERFSEVEGSIKERGLEERLKDYPELKAKIEGLLGIIENAGGDIEKAAEAEQRIIGEIRQMGNEVLHGWARRQQEKKEEENNAKSGVNRKRKKNSTGVYATGKNRDKRTDIHAWAAWPADSAVLGIGRGGMPWLLAGPATGDGGFWSR